MGPNQNHPGVIAMPYLLNKSRTLIANGNLPHVKEERRKRELSSAKYYTALTRRKSGHKSVEPRVRALTDSHLPLPQLFASGEQAKIVRRNHSVQEWESEIKKNVPPRPKFAYEPKWPPPKTPDKEELFVKTQFPHFAKADRFAIPKREFTVNPEWISEKVQRPFGLRYKTTVLRYGWVNRSIVL